MAFSRPWPSRVSPIREERARLPDDPQLDAEVEQAALFRDALVVHDVELGHAERRRHLVLDHLDLGPVADDVGADCLIDSMRRTSSRTDA